ncbi:hypothetical protein [Pseudarthrobacter polychromogenes]|uniref:Uncharacterized protein n=1 Tax=Pseudarthrobacter polychromogenes TaxID=1676 RepID=A0ABQ1XVX3_9MICC|nr:hypothetical protein [Pseudarthrobacter polychromogenes]GGH04992.1 hypothetical protein GCM10011577_31480 [Pseudarthrobacter polychromogenes]
MSKKSRTKQILRHHLKIEGLKVLSVQAAVDSSEHHDMEIEWSTRADHVGSSSIFVLGHLVAKGNRTTSAVTVVAYCLLDDDYREEISEDVLRSVTTDTSVPHVLYDIAAAASQQLLGVVQMDGPLPRTTPKAKWLDVSTEND